MIVESLKINNTWLIATLAICAFVVVLEFFTDAQKIVMIPYGIIIPISIFIPRIAFWLNKKSLDNVTPEWIGFIDFSIFLVVAFNAPLSLFFQQSGYQYDRFLHFIAPFLFVIMGVLILMPSKIFDNNNLIFHKNKYDNFLHIIFLFPMLLITKTLAVIIDKLGILKRKKSKIFFIIFVHVFAWLFIWEFIEYSIDIVFSTTIFGDFVQAIEVDFWEDIYFGFIGIVAAFFISYYSFEKISLRILKEHSELKK